jgi:hypothetical protein
MEKHRFRVAEKRYLDVKKGEVIRERNKIMYLQNSYIFTCGV